MTPTKKTIQRWIGRELEKQGITPGALARLLKAVWEKEPRHNQAVEKVLEAYDQTVGNHGTESVRWSGSWDRFWQDTGLAYSNTGDTYGMTLTYEPALDRFRFQSYGDFVERHEKEFAE